MAWISLVVAIGLLLIGFGVVVFVRKEMQKKSVDVSDEEKREAFYTTSAFQNRVFPMTKRMFRVHP